MSRRLSFSFILLMAACSEPTVKVVAQVERGPWQQKEVECDAIADWLNQIDRLSTNDSIKIVTEIKQGNFTDKVYTKCYVIWRN